MKTKLKGIMHDVLWPVFFLIVLSASILIPLTPTERWNAVLFPESHPYITGRWIAKIIGEVTCILAVVIAGKETYKIFRRKKDF